MIGRFRPGTVLGTEVRRAVLVVQRIAEYGPVRSRIHVHHLEPDRAPRLEPSLHCRAHQPGLWSVTGRHSSLKGRPPSIGFLPGTSLTDRAALAIPVWPPCWHERTDDETGERAEGCARHATPSQPLDRS